MDIRQLKQKLLGRSRQYGPAMTIMVAAGLLGLYTVSHSSAANYVADAETEQGTIAGNAGPGDVSGASGGASVKFGTSGGNGSIPLPTIAAASGKQWKNTFSEEFNGTDYDHSKLTPCFDWNYGDCTSTFNNGREHYLPSQVQVGGGIARLVAEPLSPPYANSGCYNGQCTYKAGLLSTARPNAGNGSDYLYKFTYGYVESRMKFPGTPGFFTAFWMLPADPSYSYRSEIDIVEILGGDPYSIFQTYHYNDRADSYTFNDSTRDNGNCAVKDYSQDYVRFGLDWEPTYVAWYIDGVKCGQFNGNATTIENGPMQIILHMMIDNNWERSWNSVLTDQSQTRSLDVDYIRVFQQQ